MSKSGKKVNKKKTSFDEFTKREGRDRLREQIHSYTLSLYLPAYLRHFSIFLLFILWFT